MKKLHLSSLAICATFGMALLATPANAQATRTWVSGVGDDVNPCSRTAPCKTFAGAISKTAVNGEINCLDPGGFGGVTITKSITIDCHEVYGSVLVAGTNAISIPFDSFAGTDARRSVRLRNLNFNGADTGLNGIRITGAAGAANSEVVVEDCMIDGFQGSPGRGISDERSGGGKLFVTNTTFRNLLGSGVVIFPALNSTTRIDASLSNVRVFNAAGGVAALGGSKVMVANSVFSSNVIGIDVEGGTTELTANNVVISGNGTGLNILTGGTLRLANSDVSFNTTGINGTVNSFTNNRFVSNGAGGTITPIGGPTSATGQQ